jgi:prepilin-type N-terminal cleavage/methylation domain-containing protein
MRKAFSMIELIFVIVLLGIMAKIGVSFIPDNKLLSDTHYIAMKIKEAQKNAIGYDTFSFGQTEYWKMPVTYSKDFNLTCIDVNETFLEALSDYRFTKQEIIPVKPLDKKFCFDSYGRPFGSSEQLLLKNVDINVSYNNKTNTISVLPMSGYVIIKQIP